MSAAIEQSANVYRKIDKRDCPLALARKSGYTNGSCVKLPAVESEPLE